MKLALILIFDDLVLRVLVGSRNFFHEQGVGGSGLFGGFAGKAWTHGLMLDALLAFSTLERPDLGLGNLANDKSMLECLGCEFGNARERSQDHGKTPFCRW